MPSCSCRGGLVRYAVGHTTGPWARVASSSALRVIRIYDGCAFSQPPSHFLTLFHPGYLERIHIYCLREFGVIRSDYFVRSAIHRVRLYLCTGFTLYHPSLTDTRAPPRYVPHTALLASLLAIYAIFPPAYVLGPPRLGLPLLSASTADAVVQNHHWVRIFAERE